MKKAKLMLMGIATLAVIGGAFAFKAKAYSGNFYCSATTAAGTFPSTQLYVTHQGAIKGYCSATYTTTAGAVYVTASANNE